MTAVRPPDARRVAAEVVRRVLHEGAFTAAALSSGLDAAAQLTRRDRGLATELAYGAVRASRWLEGELTRLSPRGLGGLDALARAHLLVGAYQLAFSSGVPARAAVHEAVEAVKEARGRQLAGFVNAVLRRASTALQPGVITTAQAFALGSPRWLRRAIDRALGPGEGVAFLEAGPVPAPLCVRVRTGDRDEWAVRLERALEGAAVTPGRVASSSLLVTGGGDPRAWPGVAGGALVVQEEGSQAVAEFVGARPGDRVLDACAGRGNKTLLLADAVGPEGLVDAADLHGQKLDRLAIEAARSGARVGRRFEIDWSLGTGEAPAGAYDRVLVDAPCSGTGTLRRRPEIALRRAEGDLAELATLQRAIVANAARCVRPGGELVYAVCSVLSEELERVLDGLEGWRVVETRRLAPHRDGTDGYAMARLARG